ncbi:MAG: protein-glutamate O-methyltransferase CheR [Alphaproteobacteria bacterium]|nr:protein-glutamate O-methyltransferase CheR [Alphaproteobacteria bacterium]
MGSSAPHQDFAHLAAMMQRRAGIVLTEKKSHLVENRLGPVMRRFGFKDTASLLAELRHGHEALVQAVIEAMTTNDSAFFRDRKTFDEFRDIVLPSLLVARASTKRLSIWCAACAAGQEAYSLAMLLDDRKLLAEGWTIDLYATDINGQMIARGEEGLYSQFEVQRGLPIRRLLTCFTQEGNSWRITPHLRRMVTFRKFNLLDSFGWLPDLDVVFCRNVLMYFDQKTRLSVIDRIADILAPDGALLVGPAESVAGVGVGFTPVENAPGLFYKARPVQLLRRAG